ncbi:SBBP repeat-containing protein [Myxococcota bacterium]|nr:SBBP repeat-containing protein [Myxococcota bacterium]
MRKMSCYSILLLATLFLTHCNFDTTGLKATQTSCGNGQLETGEDCDGEDLAGQTCELLGYESGTLACSDSCRFDRSQCSGGVADCGNGTIESPELCDGADLDGQTCTSIGFSGGTLACNGDCTLDTSDCSGQACGNGTVDLAEACDGENLDGQTCASIGYYGGTLACNGDCTLDIEDCMTTGRCGDGVLQKDRGEICDGASLDGQTCELLGYYGGDLACTASCTLDLAPCLLEGLCGDDAIQESRGEECDGASLDGQTCLSLGYYGGTLACDGDCLLNLEPCAASGRCGDASIQDTEGEECDGVELAGRTCETLGYYGGTLACTAGCDFDRAPCAAVGRCGDTIIQGSFGEQCDSTELAGSRCRSRGFFGGTLACSDSCLFDVTACDPSRLEGTSTADYARDMAIDASGNVYAVGVTSGTMGAISHGGSDIVVVKWNVDGVRQWVAQLGTAGNDVGRGILVDPSGAVYVTGYVTGQLSGETALGGSDIALIKLNASNGALIWHKQFGSAADEEGRALAMDGSGNVYVTGHTAGTVPSGNSGGMELVNLGLNDVFLSRITPSGTYSWGTMAGTPAQDYAIDLQLFATSNKLFIAGTTGGSLSGNGTSAGLQDVFVLRYSLTGTREASGQFGTIAVDQGFSLAFDTTHLYVTGYTEGALTGTPGFGGKDLFVAKLDPSNLNRTWTQQFGTSGSDEAFRILWAGGNSLFVGGSTSGTFPGNTSAGGNDAFLFKLRVDTGAMESVRQFGSTGYDMIFGLGKDPSGTVCMTGSITGSFMGDPSLGNGDLGVWCVNP